MGHLGHRAQMPRAAGEEGASPGQQTRCVVVGVSTEQRVPATLVFHGHHHVLIVESAEQVLQGLHCKPVCRAKPRSRWWALAPALGTWQGQEDWHGAPVGVGGKAVLLLACSPQVLDLLWHLHCAEEHLEEQMHKEVGQIGCHYTWHTGHLEDLPHHQSCLQRTDHPETALTAEVSMWQGPSVGGRGQGRGRGEHRAWCP